MTTLKVRSLPPLVDGDIFGHLTVIIDEVLWSEKNTSDIIVLLQWWGENDSVSVRPSDISRYPESSSENTRVTYCIQTNLTLFQTYLKQCNKLKLLLIKKDTKEIVGHVVINNISDLITGIQYQQYFPIITACGVRIGDLRVRFNLSMNPDSAVTSKKMKKRSRKKNKGTHNHCIPGEEDNSKKIIKSCKTCSDQNMKSATKSNPSTLDIPKTLENYNVPPNTARSDSSENVLLDVLEKGKKLRDAMVLSVLEDVDGNFDEKLLLQNLDQGSDTNLLPTSKELHPAKAGLASNEEKLINDYLNGKAMREEDEVLVLNTLHGECRVNGDNTSSVITTETKPEVPVQDGCCLSQASCAHLSSRTTSAPTDTNLTSATIPDTEINTFQQRINCFRITIESLTLTNSGWKKINNAIENRYKSVPGEVAQPAGTTYFVECHFADDSPRGQAQPWKSTPLRFCSRRQIENVVYFGQSGAQYLRQPHGVARAESAVGSGRGVVCWRHQSRPLALLGQFSLAAALPRGRVEASVSLPVAPDGAPGPPAAHLRLTVQLGRDKLYFGPALFEAPQSASKENKAPSELKEEKTKMPKSEGHALSVEDLRPEPDHCKVKPRISRRAEHNHSSGREVKLQKCKSVDNSGAHGSANIDIPICANCGQNLTAAKCKNPGEAKACVSCSSLLSSCKNMNVDPKFILNIPPDVAGREQRHHEFIVKIDTVIGFPLFSSVQDEVSCYVDYKFPEVTSNLKVELGKRETTSRVVGCEAQPALSSGGRHRLALPVAVPLAPLMAASAPGVTLRLWLRYFRPTPRDHMVALAMLPMDELCLMELEFDRQVKTVEEPVVKVLDLPLALVPSSVTAAYRHYQGLGTMRVTLTYSNQIRSPVTQQIAPEPAPRNVFPAQAAEQPRGPRPIEELLSRLTDPTEEDLRMARNRFWTGPFGKQACNGFGQNQDKGGSVRSDKVFAEASTGLTSELGPSRPVMKQDFDLFTENLEQKFNKLQYELLRERQRAINVDSVAINKLSPIVDDFTALASLSTNSSPDSLLFVLGPPANFKDTQGPTKFAGDKEFSDSRSNKSQGTIEGFLEEEKSFENCSPNKPDGREAQPDIDKPETFRANVKIDRAVNLKSVKLPSNGKKGKIPPSTWVAFETGCFEQNCASGPSSSERHFTTPIVRRNYNPIWNLSWDLDLPLDYLKQVNKRLVFRVLEENLDGVCFGTASANLSILTSGLPSLSSWLGINDLAGACKGQIKVVITPLEDLSKYQEMSALEADEELEELKDDTPTPEPVSSRSAQSDKTSASFVASHSEVFVNNSEIENIDKKAERLLEMSDEDEINLDDEGAFSADDVITNYRSTLENNFRNEMAGLENLIKFLRVGSIGNGFPFTSSNENKENLSSNPVPTPVQQSVEPRSPASPSPELVRCAGAKSAPSASGTGNHQNEKRLIDASTETLKEATLNRDEDVLSRLLQQIVSVQPPAVKIMDNTSQTAVLETRESCTETNRPDETVQMRDASTETEDSSKSRGPAHPHVCPELGSALLQHFLACRPGPVKVSDSSCQTVALPPPFVTPSTTQSSESFLRARPSGTSDELPLPKRTGEYLQEMQDDCDRLCTIDNNLKDLERFLKENQLLVDHYTIPPMDSNGGSVTGFLNSIDNSICNSQDDNSQSSNLESALRNLHKEKELPRETPDGESTETFGGNQTSVYNQGTTLKRRGTFVLDKSKEDDLELTNNNSKSKRQEEEK